MVAIIATTVCELSASDHTCTHWGCFPQIHASLNEWREGSNRDKSDFRAENYEDVYNGHVEFLKSLRDAKPIFFHNLMADLYQAVSES